MPRDRSTTPRVRAVWPAWAVLVLGALAAPLMAAPGSGTAPAAAAASTAAGGGRPAAGKPQDSGKAPVTKSAPGGAGTECSANADKKIPSLPRCPEPMKVPKSSGA